MQHMKQMPSTHACRNVFETIGLSGVQNQGTNAIATLHEQLGHDAYKVHHHLPFGLVCTAKVHRATDVQQKPRADFTVFLVLAHKGCLHARGDIPVDVPDIVMGLVFAQVGQLQARTSEQGFVIALQQAVKTAQHRPLQLLKQCLSGHALPMADRAWARLS